MVTKSYIIGTFVKKYKILSFIEMLKNKYHIPTEGIFVFSIENNLTEYIVTFKTYEKNIYLKNIKKSTVLHSNSGCLFSINALNKLVENENGTPSKEYQIEWEKYRGNMIILVNGELSIEKLNKIDDKTQLLN